MRRKWFGGLAIAAVLVTASATAVSAANQVKRTTFVGTPIVLHVSAPVTGPAFQFPGMYAGPKAAARAINAAGGIDGRQLVIKTCDTAFDPNQEIACGRDAISSHAIAEVGAFVIPSSGTFEKMLAKAGIPSVGEQAVVPPSFQGLNVFPSDDPQHEQALCTSPQAAKLSGSNRVAAIVPQSPNGEADGKTYADAAKREGANYLGTISAPLSTTDYTPYVQQLANLGNPTTVIIAGLPAAQGASFMLASHSLGKTWLECTGGGIFTGGELLDLGPAAGNLLECTTDMPLTAKTPRMAEFIRDMKAEYAAGDKAADLNIKTYNEVSLRGWRAVQIAAAALKAINGPLTGSALRLKLHTMKFKDLGALFTPVDYTKPIGFDTFPKIYNDWAQFARWDPKVKNWVLVGKAVQTVPLSH